MKIIVITNPTPVKDEALLCNLLFDNGLEILHLRKPGASREVYEDFLQKTDRRYLNRIMIHDHYELAEEYQLRGIHIRSNMANKVVEQKGVKHISLSCHSFAEMGRAPFEPEYCFLSPIFDSISKQGYLSGFSENELSQGLKECRQQVIALGGITPGHMEHCRELNFSGVAVLGYIWEKPEEALQRFIQLKTPVVMSIAGFDPSAGAGIAADLKTFEASGAYGLAVSSALTFQNQDEYTGTHWTSLEEIQRQCDLLFRKFTPSYVKIGLIEDFDILYRLTTYLSQKLPAGKIIWDPILKASAGFTFHAGTNDKLEEILNLLYLITPNSDEVKQLFGEQCDMEELQQLCRKHEVNILWKGGHNGGTSSSDRLVTPEKVHTFSVLRSPYGKHGTGCILSSALASYLAQGDTLAEACSKAQLYVSHVINSNNSNLGYHIIGPSLLPCKPSPSVLRLQYITDHKEGISICEQVEAVCQGGIRWVQLRMKEASDEEFLREGRLAKEICRRYNALFIINDRVEMARQLDADGVHLGKEDMNPLEARRLLGKYKIIGATCNTWDDVVQRFTQQVDYIGLGPFTFTTTKKKLSPVLGVEGYHRILCRMKDENIPMPVFAIGGITEPDIPALMQTGIQGIALSGLIKNSANLTEKTKEISEIVNNKR